MVIIHSYFDNKFTKTSRFDKDIYLQAELSVKFLKKYGYNVILFTDNEHLKRIKYYDDIKTINIADYKLPKVFWSGSKLISCLNVNEDYIHLDIDLFLIEDIIKDHLSKNFFCLHNEPYLTEYNKTTHKIPSHIVTKLDLDVDNIECKNMSIFGGNYKVINNIIQKVIDIASNNYSETYNILKDMPQYNWIHSVFYEQLLLTNSKISKPIPIFNFPKNYDNTRAYFFLKKHGIYHLWFNKQEIDRLVGIEKYLKSIETLFL